MCSELTQIRRAHANCLEQAVEDILVKKNMRQVVDGEGSGASVALSASRSSDGG